MSIRTKRPAGKRAGNALPGHVLALFNAAHPVAFPSPSDTPEELGRRLRELSRAVFDFMCREPVVAATEEEEEA